MDTVIDNISGWLMGLPTVIRFAAGLIAIVFFGIVADRIIRRVLIRLVQQTARRTNFTWDDVLLEHNVFGRLAQTLPALFIYFGVGLFPGLGDTVTELIRNVSLAYLALMLTLATAALMSAANTIYGKFPIAKDRPIKGFVQVAKILVYVLGSVFVVSALMAKSPIVLLTGFGAMTAILLLVFRDTILSLVASIQLTGQDMVRVGDWIEMPQYNADGDVVDVALHTVKVQNWDKTITTIPTHKLISESFRNWRGMSESGGRRIKRSVNIDIASVRFLTDEELARFREFKLLQDYIARKQSELDDYNNKLGDTANVNLRRLTNLGTFRAYLYNYLRNHPRIHHGMTLLVRQLQPAETGIPIEIYCFTDTTDWSTYEGVQADVFDHILAQSREFGIRLFQAPSGSDVLALRKTTEA